MTFGTTPSTLNRRLRFETPSPHPQNDTTLSSTSESTAASAKGSTLDSLPKPSCTLRDGANKRTPAAGTRASANPLARQRPRGWYVASRFRDAGSGARRKGQEDLQLVRREREKPRERDIDQKADGARPAGKGADRSRGTNAREMGGAVKGGLKKQAQTNVVNVGKKGDGGSSGRDAVLRKERRNIGYSRRERRREPLLGQSRVDKEKDEMLEYRGTRIGREDYECALESELWQWSLLALQAEEVYEKNEKDAIRKMTEAWEELNGAYEERDALKEELEKLRVDAIRAEYNENCLMQLEDLVSVLCKIRNNWGIVCQKAIRGGEFAEVKGIDSPQGDVQKALYDFSRAAEEWILRAQKERVMARTAEDMKELANVAGESQVEQLGSAAKISAQLADKLANVLCVSASKQTMQTEAQLEAPLLHGL